MTTGVSQPDVPHVELPRVSRRRSRLFGLTPDRVLRTAAAGSGWTLSGTFLARIAALVAALLSARVLGVAPFGAFSLVYATTMAAATLAGFGLALTATRFVAERRRGDPQGAGRYLGATLSVCLVAGTTLALTFAGAADPISRDVLGRPDLSSLLRISAPLLLLSPLVEVVAGGLAGLQRFRSMAILQGGRGVADALGLVGGAVAAGAVGAMLGTVAAELLSVLVVVILLRSVKHHGVLQISFQVSKGEVSTLLRFAVPALGASLALQPALWLGQVILAHQPNGLRLVGSFTLAYKFYLALAFIPSTIGSLVFFPMLGDLRSVGQQTDFWRLVQSYLLIIIVVTVPPALVTVALARAILSLQGAAFVSGSGALILLAFTALPSALNNLLGQTAISLQRVRLWVISDVVLAVTLAAVAVVAVPALGATGLGAAYLAAYVATCLMIAPTVVIASRKALRG